MQGKATGGLPPPDATSAAHSERCRAFIRQQIESAGGSLSFAEYMQHALYAPGLGYYAAGNTKFGAAGDFVTAPEVSPIFGRVVARQCAAVLADIAGGSILEFGAGSGRLAVDLLTKLDEMNRLPEQYLILEVSADLQDRQAALLRQAIPQLVNRVRWISALPSAHRGVIIANEVLDALPVERFVRHEQILQQRVTVEGDAFVFLQQPAPDILVNAVEEIEASLGQELAAGYESDVSLAAPGWTAGVVAALAEGAVFLFDYGLSRREYYAADRCGGWLRCHFRHHAHNDPLILPGIQDLTAWVDFSSVADAASDAGADIAGYVSQSSFLIAGGLDEELAGLAALETSERMELSAQVKMLTLPGAMGEHFKCMALAKRLAAPLGAFQTADRTAML